MICCRISTIFGFSNSISTTHQDLFLLISKWKIFFQLFQQVGLMFGLDILFVCGSIDAIDDDDDDDALVNWAPAKGGNKNKGDISKILRFFKGFVKKFNEMMNGSFPASLSLSLSLSLLSASGTHCKL